MIKIKVDYLQAGENRVIEGFRLETSARTLLITGAVGAGKTLLARALCGDFRGSSWITTSGEVQLGEDHFALPHAKSSQRTRSARTGYLPQNSAAFFITPNVESEVLVSHFCSAATPTLANERYITWKTNSPLAARSHLSPLALSGGQQRLFILDLALSTSPDHLVVDGGMSSLDDAYRQRAAEIVRSWLSEDSNRTFICFGSAAETNWFPFDHVATLSSSTDIRTRTAAPPVVTQAGLAGVVLMFDRISAGPIVDGRRLLDKVTFKIDTGQFVALRGPNGIGKSTLLRLVAGVTKPKKGKVYFLGKQLSKINWQGLRGGVGYLPQEPELAGPSAFDKALSQGFSPLDQAMWEYWQQFFSLQWSGDALTYWSMSSGQRTRASLMFQAAFRPRIWILDEPTSRIDSAEAAEFLRVLREIDPSVSAVVVSHDKEFLNSTTDCQYELASDGIQKFVAESE